ncbi:MAG: hypothetical protein ABI873_10315 [Marmoricola sp.]
MIPGQYRSVAFTDVDVALDEPSLRALLLTRKAYRRTRFVIARREDRLALVEITRTGDIELFEQITDVRLLAGPEETALLDRPDLDTAVPSQLARAAAEVPAARCVVVRGRYQHVNFVLDSDPRLVHVLDVAPPWPAKLVDQVERVVDTAEELLETLLVPEVVDLEDVIAENPPAGHYLLPCRGGGVTASGADISYLDEVPPQAAWALVGCQRSRAIHDHFYPERAEGLVQLDICPAALAARRPLPPGEARLTKCCLLEDHVETRGDTVVVPWGASFGLVVEGLALAADLAEKRRHDDHLPLGHAGARDPGGSGR